MFEDFSSTLYEKALNNLYIGVRESSTIVGLGGLGVSIYTEPLTYLIVNTIAHTRNQDDRKVMIGIQLN